MTLKLIDRSCIKLADQVESLQDDCKRLQYSEIETLKGNVGASLGGLSYIKVYSAPLWLFISWYSCCEVWPPTVVGRRPGPRILDGKPC